MEITGTSLWGNNEMYATHLQSGRVFCVGDAIHRHPPSNGLGSNTSIQDSYNLAWKLAAVLRGQAGPALLDTYSAERAPVARQIVQRANKSSREFVQFFEVLGLLDARDEAEMAGTHRGAQSQHPRGRGQTCRAGVGHGAEALRIQRPRSRAGTVLRVRRRGLRRQPTPGTRARPGTVLRAVHGAGVPAAACLGGRCPPQDLHSRPGADDPVHAADRDRRRAVGRGGREGRPGRSAFRWRPW